MPLCLSNSVRGRGCGRVSVVHVIPGRKCVVSWLQEDEEGGKWSRFASSCSIESRVG